MADAGLPAPPAPPAPQAPVPQQPVQPPVPPNQPIPAQPIPHMPKLNWSHFKLEFAGKQDEDAEEHLLRINDWMDTNTHISRRCQSPMNLSYINRGSKTMV